MQQVEMASEFAWLSVMVKHRASIGSQKNHQGLLEWNIRTAPLQVFIRGDIILHLSRRGTKVNYNYSHLMFHFQFQAEQFRLLLGNSPVTRVQFGMVLVRSSVFIRMGRKFILLMKIQKMELPLQHSLVDNCANVHGVLRKCNVFDKFKHFSVGWGQVWAWDQPLEFISQLFQ